MRRAVRPRIRLTPRLVAAVCLPVLLTAGLPAAASGRETGSGVLPPPPLSDHRLRPLQVPARAGVVDLYVWHVNLLGRAVGEVYVEDGSEAAVSWDTRGAVTVLPGLVPDPSPSRGSAIAYSQDDRQRIVGSAADADGVWRGVLWTGGGAPRVVSPPDATWAQARYVNRSGQVAGVARRDGVQVAFLWSPQTGARYLFDPRDDQTWPYGVTVTDLDDSGAVVGAMPWPLGRPSNDATTAYRWAPSTGVVDLLAGPRAAGFRSDSVRAELSESGTVAVTARQDSSSFLYSEALFAVPPGGAPVRLAEQEAASFTSHPVAVVDDRGRVVGAVGWQGEGCIYGPGWGHRAVQWDAAHGVRELPWLGRPCGEVPQATNDAGEVVGVMDPEEYGGLIYVWDARRGARLLGSDIGRVNQLSQAGHIVAVLPGAGSGSSGYSVWDPPEGLARVVAPAIADTSVVPASPTGSPTGPLGSRPWLVGGRGSSALMRFAVPKPPEGRSLVAATVLLWTTSAKGAGSSVPLEVRRVTGPWSQATTWADRPSIGSRRLGVAGVVGAGEALSVRLDPSEIPVRGGSIDLTLTGSGADGVQIGSREASDPKLRPVIELVYR